MSDTVTGLDLTRLEELAEKATPGPWLIDGGDDDVKTIVGQITHSNGLVSMLNVAEYVESDGDAEYIVALDRAAPSLLAAARAVRAVRALHQPVEDEHRAWCGMCRSQPWPCPSAAALGGAE